MTETVVLKPAGAVIEWVIVLTAEPWGILTDVIVAVRPAEGERVIWQVIILTAEPWGIVKDVAVEVKPAGAVKN